MEESEGNLQNVLGLALLGLYETIEIIEVSNGDKYWIKDGYMYIKLDEIRFALSLNALQNDFIHQYDIIEKLYFNEIKSE